MLDAVVQFVIFRLLQAEATRTGGLASPFRQTYLIPVGFRLQADLFDTSVASAFRRKIS